MKKTFLCLILSVCSAYSVCAARAKIPYKVKHPYTSTILVDGDSGVVIQEDNADKTIYPASVIKLMDLLIILEKVEAGTLKMTDWVHVTPEAAKIGGSQVWLDVRESFQLEEMLYALSIKSANDVATALAIHVAGTVDGFVKLMNQRAAELGMTATEFHSVHGLPPDVGRKPDISTARDLAILSLEIVKHPKAIHFTSMKEKWFRDNKFQLLTHNKLLNEFPGCDGLKTGYITAGGFSISASAVRDGRRVIAVVTGCKDKLVRNAKAKELLSYGFMNLPEIKPQEPEPAPIVQEQEIEPEGSFLQSVKKLFLLIGKLVLGLIATVIFAAIIFLLHYAYRQNRDKWKYKF
jgi:D-alanyl-D-alanine carboxypeptidase (penicillin-binding protein 5/6)